MKGTTTRRRGAASAEYTMVLVFLFLPCMAGIVFAGERMIESYLTLRDQVLSPFP